MYIRDEIIDRDDETKALINSLNSAEGFTICILHAPTAVGKSSVTTKLSKKLQNTITECITVRTNPINATSLSEWTFVNCIFNEFNNYYQSQECSFDNFINSNEYFLNLKIKSELEVLKDLSKDNIMFKPFLIQQMSKVSNIMDILLENENLFLYSKQEYVNYIFETREIVLIIDNLQIIDSYSLDFLRRCFHYNSLKRQFIVFEYTESNNSHEDVLKLSDFFDSDNITVKCIPVDKTDPCYIADIIDHKIESKPKDYQFNYNLISHYVESGTGNIRELIDFSLNYSQPESICLDKTVESVLRLDQVELYVLFTLLEFDGCIEIECFEMLSEYANINDYEEALEQLCDKRLIKCTDCNYIEIEHASITDALKTANQKLIIARNSTVNSIKSYIEKQLSGVGKISYQFLRVLLNIYKRQCPLEILNLLQYIEASILVNLQPLEAWEYFSAFINVTIDDVKSYSSLYITIFKLCFKFELYKEGFSCIEKTYPYFDTSEMPIVIIYRMLYLAALDKHNENIAYFASVKGLIAENERLYLTANLAVLSSYRSLGDNTSCLKIHKALKKHTYKKYAEYGYRNRLVDMYLSRSKSIRFMKRSIRKFEAENQTEQLAKTFITYTHVLGGLGKTKAARKQLAKAEALLEGRILGKHMVFVNEAVLNLVDGNFGTETYRLLDMAETSAIVPFDHLAIIVNKLAWCYENKRYDLVHVLEKKAKEFLPLEPDKHVHSLLYYNLYANYKTEGRANIANQYLYKAKQTMQYCEPVKARLSNKPTSETRFILSKPWHICYLTYWTFDILFE